jgi:hypothetical protein
MEDQYTFCQYSDNQSPEDGSRTNCRKVMYIIYLRQYIVRNALCALARTSVVVLRIYLLQIQIYYCKADLCTDITLQSLKRDFLVYSQIFTTLKKVQIKALDANEIYSCVMYLIFLL